MTQAAKIPGTEEAWDNGKLGADEKHVQVADKALQDAVTNSLGMQAISIRMPRDLVEQYKLIAHYNGIGYQPLMRDALARFATGEMKRILVELANKKDEAKADAAHEKAHRKAA